LVQVRGQGGDVFLEIRKRHHDAAIALGRIALWIGVPEQAGFEQLE